MSSSLSCSHWMPPKAPLDDVPVAATLMMTKLSSHLVAIQAMPDSKPFCYICLLCTGRLPLSVPLVRQGRDMEPPEANRRPKPKQQSPPPAIAAGRSRPPRCFPAPEAAILPLRQCCAEPSSDAFSSCCCCFCFCCLLASGLQGTSSLPSTTTRSPCGTAGPAAAGCTSQCP